MMTKQEYEATHPLGSVNVQVDGNVRPMTESEWRDWVDETWQAESQVDEP